jgi:hypothetical protein
MDCRLFTRGFQVLLAILILSVFAGSAAAQGGITGLVVNATTVTPVSGVGVQVYTSTGNFSGFASTNTEGVFTVTGLAAGMYFARTFNSAGFTDQVFGAATGCFGSNCPFNVTSGLGIAVVAGSNTPISFSLVPGGTIMGVVTNATTGAVVPDVIVNMQTVTTGVSTQTVFVASVLTNASGVYKVTGLPTASYFVYTNAGGNSLGLVDQVYNGVTCFRDSCTQTTAGTPVPVTAPGTTPNINFALAPGGALTGTVTNATTGAVVPGVVVSAFTSTGISAGLNSTTNASGVFKISGLATGSYVVRTNSSVNSLGLVDQLFSGFFCTNGSCNVVDGTPIPVTAPSTTANVNFNLAPGGSITGTVTNATTPGPAPGVSVQAFSGGVFAGQVMADINGTYTLAGLPTASYNLQTSNSLGFVNQASGVVVAVTAAAAAAGPSFALTCTAGQACATGGAITGTVTNAVTLAPVAGVTVSVFNFNGSFLPVSSVTTNAAGVYIVPGLPTGTYQVNTGASSFFGLSNRSAVIAVTAPGTVAGVNFPLTPLSSLAVISGTVTNAITGAPVPGVRVQFFNTNNINSVAGSGTTSISGAYAAVLFAGQYIAVTSNSEGFVDQLYPFLLQVTTPSTVGGVNFALSPTRIIGVTGNFPFTLGSAVSSTSLDLLTFGKVKVGTASTQTLTITNAGGAAMTVTGVSYPAGFSGDFQGGIIPSGGSQVVHVTFAPTAATGYGGTITFSGNQTGGTNTITVAGNAKASRADFDGNGKADLTVYRPTTGEWFVLQSSSGYSYSNFLDLPWGGVPGDIPLSGDFDGDGITDLAIYRPANGTWYIRYSSQGYSFATYGTFQWGIPGDIPVVADFDGDGKDDHVVYRPSSGEWFISYSSSNFFTWTSYQWGQPGDMPLAADFDGDGIADLAVYRPTTGEWLVRESHSGYSYSTDLDLGWGGVPGDIPLSGDFDGDGITDLAIFRPANGTWYIRYSSQGYSFATYATFQWGIPGDIPVVADLDGDGIADLVVWRPSNGTWYVRLSSNGYVTATWTSYQWGLPGDVPLGEAAPVPGAEF